MKTSYLKTIPLLIGLSFLIFGCATTPEGSQPDAKMKAIERYLGVVPTQEVMNDMAVKFSKTMPEQNREAFIELMTKKIDINVLEDAMKASMQKHFTIGEINALADFYSKPEGRSVMKKMPDYMADVMPVIHAEIKRAITEQRKKQQ